jgi:membrane protease YdiL (CAAX protease family)
VRVLPEAKPDERRGRLVIAVVAASAGMVVFALFSHRGPPWIVLGAIALLVVAAAIGRSLRRATRPAALLGLGGLSRRAVLFSIVGAVIGTGAGLLHRKGLGIPLWPVGGLEAFAAVACLIGATEELLYRGWIQGTARPFGWPAAVAIAAVAHAAYKTALFAWPPGPIAIDYAAIGLWTVAGGIVIGLLREISGSVVPSMLAHAAFDFVVYGALAHAPWWVWA